MVIRQQIVPLMDLKLELEYRTVALRAEHVEASGLTRAEVLELIEAMEAFAEPVKVRVSTRPLSPDPNDDMVLDLAVNGRADVLVTSNKKHFAAAEEQFGIAVLSPAELLLKIRRRKSMPSKARKVAVAKFPLRLMPSVRRTAEAFSEKEDVFLNQFINVAVAEKLAHLEHEEWVRNRKQPTSELATRALAASSTNRPESGSCTGCFAAK